MAATVDTNRTLSRQLHRAKDALETDDFGPAIEFLQERILDRPDDFFLDQDLDGSLKGEARRLLQNLNAAQQRHYDLRYVEPAKQMLAQARADQDLNGLADVARRYFLTEAGAEAAYLLGSAHLDQGRPLQAALQFSGMLDAHARKWEPAASLKQALSWRLAGFPGRAKEVLVAAKKRLPQARFDAGLRVKGWFESDEGALAWLDQAMKPVARGARPVLEESWTQPRGEAARNGSAVDVSPLWRPLWTVSTLSREEAADADSTKRARQELQRLNESHRGTSFLGIPAASPVAAVDVVPPVFPRGVAADSTVVDSTALDVVVFRTMANVRAVHLGTGRTLWESIQIDPAYERVVEGDLASAPANGQGQGSPLQMFLTQRAWRDVTAGTLSTDGERVYSVEDVGFINQFQQYMTVRGIQSPLAPSDSNRLIAIELNTGRLLWEAGGPRTGRELPLAGTFFLGAPLALDGRLYVIGENGGEISLYVLNAATGQPEWTQSLVVPDANIELLTSRRLVGLSPALWNGILVCPTDGGIVVGFDLESRTLLWGLRYAASTPATVRMNPWQINMQRISQMGTEDESRWIDSTPVIAEGRVLVTPRDSEDLFCLQLTDGQVEWKRPRGQSLTVAAVHDGKAIVVGRSQVEALNLAGAERLSNDLPAVPKPAWREPTPIAMPSGRGVRCGGLFHLPLSTGEIATLDLKTGKLVSRSKTRDGQPAGNLIAARGALISQTIDSITALEGLETVETQIASAMKGNPDDATALALRGELRLHRGQDEAALVDLRRSVAVDSKSPARPILAAVLLEGLRHDFAANRSLSNEIETLLDNPAQRAAYLRLTAAGLHRIGDRRAAFGQYLKLIGPDVVAPTLERVSGELSVRSDRWVRARLAEIVAASSDEERTAFDDMVRGRLEEILGKDDAGALHNFLSTFGDLPLADQARKRLSERLDSKKDGLAYELLLMRLRQSPDETAAAYATHRLVELYVDRERYQPVPALLEDLDKRFAEVVAFDGKTGHELAEQWKSDDNVLQILAGPAAWPERNFEAKKTPRRGNVEQEFAIDIVGPRGPMEGWKLWVDARRQNIIARDAQGQDRWSLRVDAIKDPKRPNEGARQIPNVIGNSARVHGHLLVVTLGSFFAVVDTLVPGASPQVLWVRDLYEPNSNGQIPGVQVQPIALPGGIRQIRVVDNNQRPLGAVGIVVEDYLCYQVATTLFAADPVSGDILWERRNMTRGSEVFGDRQNVFVVPPGSQQVNVLRATDGEFVGTKPLPAAESRLLMDGRRVVAFQKNGNDGVLYGLDPATGQRAWERGFTGDARMTIIKDDEVAVLEPRGRFAIFSVRDGSARLESDIGKQGDLEQIGVVRSTDRYILLTNVPAGPVGRRVQPTNYYARAMIVNGPVWSFDRRTGKPQWTARVEFQQFELNQPEDLPVLVFAAQRFNFQQPNQFGGQEWGVQIVDSRNGRTIHNDTSNSITTPYRMRVDTTKKSIGIDFFGSGVEMTLTESPLVPGDLPASLK